MGGKRRTWTLPPWRPAGHRLLRRGLAFLPRREGAILVEAAIALPILIILFLGMVEFATAFTAQRKVASVAATIAELVAQNAAVSEADLADMVSVGGILMAPYAREGLSVVIVSVGRDDKGKPVTLWSYGSGDTSQPGPFDVSDLGGLLSGAPSIIAVRATYTHRPIATMFLGALTLSSESYFRPRMGSRVERS